METETIMDFTDEELSTLPAHIRKKFVTCLKNKEEEINATKTFLRLFKNDNEKIIADLKEEVAKLQDENQNNKKRLDSCQSNLSEAEERIKSFQKEVEAYNIKIETLEKQVAEFRLQRDTAIDQRDAQSSTLQVEQLDNENLKKRLTLLTKELREVSAEKYQAIAKLDQIKYMETEIQNKERNIEQERAYLNQQIIGLKEEASRYSAEVVNTRKDYVKKLVTLHEEVSQKVTQLHMSEEMVTCLTNQLKDAREKLERNAEAIAEMKNVELDVKKSFQDQLDEQMKLTELYKELSNSAEARMETLVKGTKEMQDILSRSATAYGKLEKESLETIDNLQKICDEQEEQMKSLRNELEKANELLKAGHEDALTKALENISPTAAAAQYILNSGLTLTEFYAQHCKVTDELLVVKNENRRMQETMENIIKEMNDKTPEVMKLREDYKLAVKHIASLSLRFDVARDDVNEAQARATKAEKLANHYKRENERLTTERNYLAKQVEHLLKEVEYARSGTTPPAERLPELPENCTASDIIDQRLVKFGNMEELLENNKKLLLTLRALAKKLEDMEASAIDPVENEAKIKSLEKTIELNKMSLEQSENMKTGLQSQINMYKEMYENAVAGKKTQLEQAPAGKSASLSPDEGESNKLIEELRKQVQELKQRIKEQKEEYDSYRQDRREYDKNNKEELNQLRDESTRMKIANSKLLSKLEYSEECNKVQQNNLNILRKQVESLEARNKAYADANHKYEQTSEFLRERTMELEKKNADWEERYNSAQRDIRALDDERRRLAREKQSHDNVIRSQSVVKSNIDALMLSIEGKDMEEKIKLSNILEDCNRECAALRRRLQEEQNRCVEDVRKYERIAQLAQERLDEEKKLSAQTKADLCAIRQQLAEKSAQVDKLNSRLKDANNQDAKQAEIDNLEKQVKNLQIQLQSKSSDYKELDDKFTKCFKENKDFLAMVKNLESKNIEDANNRKEELAKIETLLQESKKSEAELKLQVEQLQDRISKMATSSVNLNSQATEELSAVKAELSDIKKQLEDSSCENNKLIEKNVELQMLLDTSEKRFSLELDSHNADMKRMESLKEKLQENLKCVTDLEMRKSQAETHAEEIKSQMNKLRNEHESQVLALTKRMEELEVQNNMLLEQIESFGNKLSFDSSNVSSANTSLNLSNISNISQPEEDENNPTQLLEIIKYLRRQKDISHAAMNVTKAENNRLQIQTQSLEKELQSLRDEMHKRDSSESAKVVAGTRMEELMRKVENYNALSDSNKILRDERMVLNQKVNELTKVRDELERQLGPLIDQNKELAKKLELSDAENRSFKENEERLRVRISALVERSVRAPPEEWRRLQNERDQLAKNFISERDAHQKLQEDMNAIKQEKDSLNQECQNVKKCVELADQVLQSLLMAAGITEKKPNFKDKIEEVKSVCMKKVESTAKLEKEIKGKDAQIADLLQKDMTLRKIAKKYKNQYEELQKSLELKKTAAEEEKKKAVEEALANVKVEVPLEKQEEFKEEGRQEIEHKLKEAEERHNNAIKELTEQMTTLQSSADTLRKKNESLQTSAQQIEDRSIQTMKSAHQKIDTLKEENASLSRQLLEAQSKGADTNLLNENSQLQEENSDLKSEKMQLTKQVESLSKQVESVTKENQSLQQRMNIMQRQLEKQQGSGATEKASMDPPTANIKPIPGPSSSTSKSSQGQQSAAVAAWAGRDTPFASVRPMSLPARTAAVFPTSQTSSGNQTQSSTQVVTPQQQVAHTTMTQEVMSTSPTSSHTEYVSASSSAGPTLRQVVVQPTPVSTQDTEPECSEDSTTAPQQVVAMVLPRIEQQGSSSSQSSDMQVMEPASSQTASSSSVTTTQAGVKRQRDSDSVAGSVEEEKLAQQAKRIRGPRAMFQTISSQGNVDVEYQVPTSSQRDQDDELVIESDGGEDMEDDEEEEIDDEEDEGLDDNEMPEYESEGADIDEDSTREQDNEAEVTEDTSEVPNQSVSDSARDTSATSSDVDVSQQQQSEATSSGTVQTSSAAAIQNVAVPIRRSVPPLSRQQQQQLVLPQGYEDAGDDSIVPSTPTLFVPRRTDSFGEAVGSPQVPQGRFTFSETNAAPSSRAGIAQVASEGMDDTRMDLSQLEDSGTGRSVPTTPLQVSPQEVPGEVGQSVEEGLEVSQADMSNVPTITVTEVDAPVQTTETTEAVSESDIGEVDLGESTQDSAEGDVEDILDAGNEVTSGEKQQTTEELEEGREAEGTEIPSQASPVARGRVMQVPRIRGTGVGERGERGSVSGERGGKPERSRITWGDSDPSSSAAPQQRVVRGGSTVQRSFGRGRRLLRSKGRGPFGGAYSRM